MLVAHTMSAPPVKLAGQQRSRTRTRPKPASSANSSSRQDASPTSSDAAASSTNDSVPMSATNGDDYRAKYSLEDLELITTLGTGTFGRVVLAKHRGAGEYFALKMLAISEVIRLKQVEHVRSEKSILMTVTHPFIVNMIDTKQLRIDVRTENKIVRHPWRGAVWGQEDKGHPRPVAHGPGGSGTTGHVS